MLDERKSAVLRALVEAHIRTGEPVSSSAIRDAAGLTVSTATIRNELAALDAEGYASQPHTSAGRVPTDKAYRYYVDHLSPVRLRANVRARIDDFFTSVHRELSGLLQQTSDLLADLTHYPAVVLGPGLATDAVHGVHLVRLGPETLLVVIVAESGRIAKDLARLARPVGADEVRAAERLLNDALAGKRVGPAIEDATRMASERSPAVTRVVQAATEVVKRSEASVHDIYYGGTSQLTALWEDLRAVHRVLEFLEREAMMLELLDEAGEGTSVRIGSELNVPAGRDLAVVTTTYEAGESGRGRVGVLGPMRMNYRRTIRVVEEVSEGLGDSLTG